MRPVPPLDPVAAQREQRHVRGVSVPVRVDDRAAERLVPEGGAEDVGGAGEVGEACCAEGWGGGGGGGGRWGHGCDWLGGGGSSTAGLTEKRDNVFQTKLG